MKPLRPYRFSGVLPFVMAAEALPWGARVFLMVTDGGAPRRSLRRPIANATSGTPKAECPATLLVTINKILAGNTGGVTGKASRSVGLHEVVSGMVPLWFDVGYRFTPALYVGAFFQYGFAFVNDSCRPGVSCSAHDVAFGANLHYHAQPQGIFDPWLGAGFGYELLTVNESDGSYSWTAKGFQFLILQAGGDFKATPDLAVGPFVNLALGTYSGYSSQRTIAGTPQEQSGDLHGGHGWLTLGLRGQYNL